MVKVIVIGVILLIICTLIIVSTRGILHVSHKMYIKKSVSKIKVYKENNGCCANQSIIFDACLNDNNMIFSTGIINRQLVVFDFNETSVLLYYIDINDLDNIKNSCVRYTYDFLNRKKCFLAVEDAYLHVRFNGDKNKYVYCSTTKCKDVLLNKFLEYSKLKPKFYITEMVFKILEALG